MTYHAFTYKLVFGLIDASLQDFFVPRFNEARLGHDYKISHTKMELTPT